MSNAAKHRKKAAEFEQLRQIDRAIASYVRAIEESELAGEDVDVALLNKVGDLALRQGRVPDAITYYERAVEHYANSGLFNNAIALCNKILRNAPGRANVYFTLGRICARKGLRGDATRNFLEYATRMQQEERVDEGMRALAEVADLMPELTEVRRLVDEHADRAGIVLPRRRTPSSASMALSDEGAPSTSRDKSQDLIFLEVDYGAPVSRRTPVRQTRMPTPPPLAIVPAFTVEAPIEAPVTSNVAAPDIAPEAETSVGPALEAFMIFDPTAPADAPVSPPRAAPTDEVHAELLPGLVETSVEEPVVERLAGLEAAGDFADFGATPLEGLTVDELESADAVVDPTVHARDVTWLQDAKGLAEVHEERGFEPTGEQVAIPDPHQQLDEVMAEDFAHAEDDPGVANVIHTETPLHSPTLEWFEVEEAPDLLVDAHEIEALEISAVPELDAAIAAGEQLVAEAEAQAQASVDDDPFELLDEEPIEVDEAPVLRIDEPAAVQRAPFRIDPHDFILPGELPPLLLGDDLVEAGLAAFDRDGSGTTSFVDADVDLVPGDTLAAAVAPATAGDVDVAGSADKALPPAKAGESGDDIDLSDEADVDDKMDRAPLEDGRPVMVTPSLPIAAVAAEATIVASSRRDALRAAVAKLPQDWLLRRRLAEALFEAGERDAGLAELEAAQQGLVAQGDLPAGADIADTLVQVAPERVAFHQKRVELSVRIQDQGRLRVAYLDLADALVRIGEENRARAVYARVLEIDPYDDRARAALGSAAPPPPPKPGSDANFVDLADWLRDDDAPASTRMRMREPAISGDEQADFDALLRHFKEGVARSLGEDDHESHYDLGVAYKEMGLLDDAIEEFQKALRSRSHRLPAYEALGQCFVEQGRHQVAATVLSRALHEPGLDDEQRVGVLYLLAYSCEALQRWDEARSYYQRVYATDIHFRDAAARLAALDQVAR
ncbi:tetratricopeptide repeat protein [Gemmatimonas groenlandica]|uniref:Tetratricopeptide repeat protein n=1 Tax=Gemmatimonas groenlandica TaxID=2732249 RepID=A0A6M4IN49_9BACT|nr:tetratricopeptide repeat protein [Gemmatimonas groenlandica]QJR34857.1 tetratricopeptide repeat protein [Gemmatimonas groenlandica]